AVTLQDGEPGLRAAQRQLLVLKLDPGRQDGVLQRVLALGQCGRDQARFAGLPQAVEPLAILALGRLVLGFAQRSELVAREEIRVPAHDLGALRDLLLADAHRAAFLRALEQIALEARLVFRRAEDRSDAHRRANLQHAAARSYPPFRGRPYPFRAL